jgi:sialic acid synthase SpsE
MCSVGEIDWAVGRLKKRGARHFGILHGQHIMSSRKGATVPPELTQLDCIRMFKDRYQVPVGYVDHTSSVYLPAFAAAKGADIVMKHLAPRPNWRGPDWQVCLTPKQWKESREILRYAILTSGDSKELSNGEMNDRKIHRRSLYTSRALGVGHRMTAQDMVALRPGDGVEPRDMPSVIGKRVRQPLDIYHKISLGDLE